jgi:hypothetical protein
MLARTARESGEAHEIQEKEMPRCCATIVDPKDTSKPLVHVEVDHPDEAAGKRAASEAAKAAYKSAHATDEHDRPEPRTFTLPGALTHTVVDVRFLGD